MPLPAPYFQFVIFHFGTSNNCRSICLARFRRTPTLLVLQGGSVVRRLEGRATGRQIEALIRPFLDEA